MSSFFDSASLVQIPSGYSDGTLYSVKPIDGSGDLTFSRGSDIEATRVAANGYIEKAKVNLLLQSNTFSTTWTPVNFPLITGGQSGYDGSSDAWLIASNGTANAHISQNISAGVASLSVYAKAGTLNWMRLYVDISGANASAWFDLSNGVTGTAISVITTSIVSVGGGWHRCTLTVPSGGTAVRINPSIADSDVSQTSGNIYIQDAQLNYGLVAQEYQETTTTSVVSGITNDMPRLDYSGGASCPSLLLEPSRTNVLTQSEYFGAWNGFNASLSDNETTSPEGVINAARLTEDSSNAFHDADLSYTYSAGTYTFSVFAKADERSVIFLQQFDGVTFHSSDNFDLSAGTYAGGSEGLIEPFGNGWHRCSFTATAAAGSGKVYVNLHNGTSGSYQGDGTSGVYLYGAQLEQGSYSTSLIPTYGTSATRTADACSKTGISSLIGQTEGTLFAEVDFEYNSTTSSNLVCVHTGSSAAAISINRESNNRLQLFVFLSGAVQANIITTSQSVGTYKIAATYKQNDFKLYVNGSLIGTDTSGNIPTASVFGVGNLAGSNIQQNQIKQAIVFPTALSDAQLAELTA